MNEEIKDYIKKLRNDFSRFSLDENSVNPDPFVQFGTWFREAMEAQVYEPNAMVLSTCSSEARPSARVVLLRDFSHDGFSFFTNYKSKKSREILQNPFGALTFYWPELERQVRVEGKIRKMDEEASDIYFKSRPKASQVGAHISPQSETIESRSYLEELHSKMMNSMDESEIKRPDFWGGFILEPDYWEFWQGRPGRLHDRIVFESENKLWKSRRIAP